MAARLLGRQTETLQEIRPGGEQPRRVLEPPTRAALPLARTLGVAHPAPVDASERGGRVVLDPELDALGRGAIGEARREGDRHVDAGRDTARGEELAVLHEALAHVARAE